jgi:hypothetical protein
MAASREAIRRSLDEAAILGHCRRGEHARGCWLVDLLI